jgi:GNAT superfamily N-acetyltransferase
MGVRVCRLSVDDWETLRMLRLRALEESPGAFLGDFGHEMDRPDIYWRDKCSVEYWFVANVGVAATGLAKLAQPVDGPESMHIESMWVVPEYRRTGVGRAIVRRLETAARNLGESEIRLWIFTENKSGRVFFERLGYGGPVKLQLLSVGTINTFEQEFRKDL